MRHAMELALATLDANTHLHVSFDVDFLDPDIAPGVGTTVPGGPTYREAQLCMEMIADSGRLASLDVMELNPALDLRNKTAELAVDLIESLFGKSTLMRDLMHARAPPSAVSTFDFVIVGAGIAGATLAARLAAHGSVLLLERESSRACTAPAAAPRCSWRATARRRRARSRAPAAPPTAPARAVAARRALRRLAGPGGLLDAQLAALQATGSAVQRIDAAAGAGARAGAAADRPDRRHRRARRDGHRRARAAPAAPARRARARRHAVDRRRARSRAQHGAATAGRCALAGGRTCARRMLVNAAGAWADTVAQRAGLAPLGLQPRRRSAFTFDAPRPRPPRLAVGGAASTKAGTSSPTPASCWARRPTPTRCRRTTWCAEEIDIATGIARIEARTTLAIRRPRRTWAGLRTFAPDGELVIGADPRAAGLLLARRPGRLRHPERGRRGAAGRVAAAGRAAARGRCGARACSRRRCRRRGCCDRAAQGWPRPTTARARAPAAKMPRCTMPALPRPCAACGQPPAAAGARGGRVVAAALALGLAWQRRRAAAAAGRCPRPRAAAASAASPPRRRRPSRPCRAPASASTNARAPRLLQVRTLLKTQDSQSSVGSGFLVDDGGLLVTNYHVVSQYALQPSRHRLVYATRRRPAGRAAAAGLRRRARPGAAQAGRPGAAGRPRRRGAAAGRRAAAARRAHLLAGQPARRRLCRRRGQLQRPGRAQLPGDAVLRRLAQRRHERRPGARRAGPADRRQRGGAARRRAGQLPGAGRAGARAAGARARRQPDHRAGLARGRRASCWRTRPR